jgi:hypothetical protein
MIYQFPVLSFQFSVFGFRFSVDLQLFPDDKECAFTGIPFHGHAARAAWRICPARYNIS